MIKPIFCVKDVKTSFWSPFVDVNEQSAMREFGIFINSDNDFVKHNAFDLELWSLGTFDTDTGSIVSEATYLVSGRDLRSTLTVVKDGDNVG